VRRTVIAAASSALLAAASCGSQTVSAPPIPARALPGNASDTVALDVQAVATDATQIRGLETLLTDAGFTGGSQRLFSTVTGGRKRMLARVLEFESAAGADRYVAWLSDHVEEVIGEANADPALQAPGGGTVYVHEPDPCCHNETRIFLAVWTEGDRVVTLEVGGPAARASRVPDLIARLDAAL
jgi:hypothetical protein